MPRQQCGFAAIFLAWLFSAFASFNAFAQANAVLPNVTEAVDASKVVRLPGNTHSLARPEFDRGPAPDDLPMARMLLVLKRSPEQEADLRRLLDEQQVKSSPNYHKWLTPEEFGERFGPAPSDVQAVTDWLGSQGFDIGRVAAGRTVIEFSGNAGMVRDAFHTEIHQYEINGEKRWANATDPEIPQALAPVIAGIASLNNFPRKPLNHLVGKFERSKATGEVKPLFTIKPPGSTYTYYPLGPYDFATIYNLLPLWNAGTDGTGETIAIVGDSNINLQDVRDFRAMFGLPAKDPQVILDGPDPGLSFSETEADLDVEWSGAVAKNATIDLVVSEDTETTAGVDLSALYIVDNNLAPVMSVSFGLCEAFLSASVNAFYNAVYEQAAAQGITVTVASGDSGSAGCDPVTFDQSAAEKGLAVSGLASTPFNVAVGGTDFNDFGTQTTYWNPTNNASTGQSAKSYIPETPWNSSCARSGSLTDCAFIDPYGVDLAAGGGGPSTLYSKPSWQTGPGIPNDGHRDIPDVSLFAALDVVGDGGGTIIPGSMSFYIVCDLDATGTSSCNLNSPYTNFIGLSGTSASAPTFAGIMALVNQKTGQRQGNADYVLYNLAAQPGVNCTSDSTAVTKTTCTYYDITTSNNSVVCYAGSPNCDNSGPAGIGVLVDPANSNQPAWNASSGYDMATGLGSVNAANLVKNWSSATFAPTTTTLALSTSPASSPITLTHGQPVNVNVTVAPNSGTGTPTGDVSLIAQANGNPANSQTGIGPFTLSSGSVSGATTNMLPGGSYNVIAHYAGDGTFGTSDSTPVAVTVTKGNSQPAISLVTIDPNTGAVTGSGTTAVYGSLYLLRVDVEDGAGQKCSPNSAVCPTGQVALSLSGEPVDKGTYLLNSFGFAEDLTPLIPRARRLAGGTNNIVASYSGDNSFNLSSPSIPIIITPDSTTMFVSPAIEPGPLAGTPIQLLAQVYASSFGVAPTGTISFFLDGAPLTGTISLTTYVCPDCQDTDLDVTLTTTIPASGDHTLTATYSGDQNYAPATSAPDVEDFVYPDTLTLKANPSGVLPGGTVTLTALLDTSRTSPAPTGSFGFYGDTALNSATVTTTPVTDGNGNAALQATITYIPGGTEKVFVGYGSDVNYLNASAQTNVIVGQPDFSLALNPSGLNVNAGQTASAVITATALSTFSGTISFACLTPLSIPEATCTLSPASVNTSTSANITLTITTTAPSTTYPPLRPDWFTIGGGLALAAIFALFLEHTNKRRLKVAHALMLAFTLAALLLACGGGGGGGGGSHNPGTMPGNYNVVVTATSGNLTHTVTLGINVL